MARLSLESIVEAVNDLPAFPTVVTRVIQLTDDPDSTAQDINNVLNQDQAITARVLRLANSAFYGYTRRINTVTDAVVFMGFKTIRSIVIAASVSDILNKEMAGYALEHGELWRHSQCCAMAARLIARKAKFPALDLAYTAGLLHDIGKVILNNTMKESYIDVVERATQGEIPFNEVETEILGFTHADVGSQVAAKWNLTDQMVEAIAFHHDPDKATINPKLTAIIHLADAICVAMGIGIGVDGMLYPMSANAMELLGMDENTIESVINDLSDLLVDQTTI
ncbi:MAG: HDOD domain-containing protein [Syntrophomonadaceae bacterium]|nr:HDOD domain-containing protein [Syntrophomonadaceae bacterium]